MQIGDNVAWTMQDGHTMAGQLERITGKWSWVRRVDGTICAPRACQLRPATYEDTESAIRFFANIGK